MALALFLMATDADAAISRVGATAGVQEKTTDKTLTIASPPAVTASGDLMLMVLSVSGVSLNALTPPTGWTQINLTTGASHSQAVFRKFAGVGEAGPYTTTWNYAGGAGGNDRALAYIVAYRYVDPTSPIDVAAGQYNASNSTVTAPAIITTAAGSTLVGFFGLSTNVGGGTLPASMGNAYSQNTGGGGGGTTVLTGDEFRAATGGTGTRAATFGASAVSVGHLIALRPDRTFRVEAFGAGLIGTQVVGTSFNIRITALNPNNTTDTGFTGTVTISSTGNLSVGSGVTAVFTAGVLTSHTVRISNTGTFNITATGSSASNAGISNDFLVAPKLQILAPGETAAPGSATGKTGTPSVQAPGVAFNVIINAVDEFWNLVNTATDTITLTSSDGTAVLPGAAALVAGTQTASVTLNTPSSQTVTANAVVPTRSNTSAAIPLAVAVGSFNAFETSTAAGAITGKIFTKLAGIGPFGLDVVAISGGAQSAGFSNNVKVELLANTGTPGSGYGADNCPTSSTVLQTIASIAIAGGRSTVSLAAVASAYRDVRVRISYPTVSPTVTTCSTDSFSIRPQAFTVTSSNANADATGVSTVAAPVIKAGSAFALTATAVAGYSTTPILDPSLVTAHVGAVAAGVPAGLFAAANPVGGVASGAAFTYTEVGYFRLSPNGVYDDQFTAAVDSSPGDCTADFSNTLVGGKYGCKFGNTATTTYFGRFVPDRFALTAGSFIDRAAINTGSSEAICPSPFSYMGEDFKTTFTLTAQNSTPATTQNYTGGHAKFVLTTWSNFVFTASGGTLTQGSVPPTGTWSSAAGAYGTAAVTATHKIARPAAPLAPLTSFSVSAQPSYADGTATIALAASAATHAGTSELRFGRLRLLNAYGSNLLQLRVPLLAEYFDSGNWKSNTADSCTTVVTTAVAIGNRNPAGLGSSATSVQLRSGGKWDVIMAVPTQPGSADVALDLGTGTAAADVCLSSWTTGPSATTGAGLSFLLGQWCGGTYSKAPLARIRFGSPKAPYIYLRERY